MEAGAKVVCIASYWKGKEHIPNPIKGEVYTVGGAFEKETLLGPMLYLRINEFPSFAYLAKCFAPIQTQSAKLKISKVIHIGDSLKEQALEYIEVKETISEEEQVNK